MSLQPQSTTFRDMVATLSPSWLRGPIGSRFMYSMAIQFDNIGDLVAYAVLSRFPDYAPPDAIPVIANDRQISQGFQEPLAAFRVRLVQWLDRWAHAGSPWGVLMAVRGYVSPDNCEVACVNNNGAWDYYSAGATCDPYNPPTHVYPGAPWRWDNVSWPYMYVYAWWRMWVVIWPSASTWVQTTAKYDDGVTKYNAGVSYDWSGTLAEANGLRAAVKRWKSSNTWVPWIIVSFDPTGFQPGGGGAEPDGTYGTWVKVTYPGVTRRPVYAYSRDQAAAYLDGVS